MKNLKLTIVFVIMSVVSTEHENLQLFTAEKCPWRIAVFRPACTQLCAWTGCSRNPGVWVVPGEVRSFMPGSLSSRAAGKASQMVLCGFW